MGCFGVDGRIVSNTAIRVENLGKQYRIGATQARYRTIRETVTDAARAPFVRAGKLLRGEATGAANLDETIWALKDVSFEVKHGEVVGIIGRNGAGKSTLLKILSRITEPTTGYVDLYGRVGSLLEVGTGFHPELTGRENIFLNGAILGMSRNDINRKFDEIVDFAEVERFIDTPVKHYSSGMYLRLAFAVAAHLEPEILLVDEVLAVGDAAFQKKCLGKMGDVAQEGRTVLFVSHNMGAVRNLCGRSVLVSEGRILFSGSTDQAVSQYLHTLTSGQRASIDLPEGESGGPGRARRLYFTDKDGRPSSQFRLGQKWYIVMEFEMFRVAPQVVAAVGIVNFESVGIATYWSTPTDLMPGKYRIRIEVDLPLSACDLQFAVGLSAFGGAFYYKDRIGHVAIDEVATDGMVQPARARAGGLLSNNGQAPAIEQIE